MIKNEVLKPYWNQVVNVEATLQGFNSVMNVLYFKGIKLDANAPAILDFEDVYFEAKHITWDVFAKMRQMCVEADNIKYVQTGEKPKDIWYDVNFHRIAKLSQCPVSFKSLVIFYEDEEGNQGYGLSFIDNCEIYLKRFGKSVAWDSENNEIVIKTVKEVPREYSIDDVQKMIQFIRGNFIIQSDFEKAVKKYYKNIINPYRNDKKQYELLKRGKTSASWLYSQGYEPWKDFIKITEGMFGRRWHTRKIDYVGFEYDFTK